MAKRNPRSSAPKKCGSCLEVLPAAMFGTNPRYKAGLQSYCRACDHLRKRRKGPYGGASHESRERAKAKQKEWARSPEGQAYRLLTTYGMTVAQHALLREEQEERCAACRDLLTGGRTEHIDHDHITGSVRGILCRRCNLTLGQADESSTRLRALAAYIDRCNEGDGAL